MTTQTTVFDGLPTGLTLTGKAFDTDAPDTEVTGNTFGLVEGANAKGRYVVTITRATALPAGDYDIRLFVGSVPIAVGRFRFAGTDGETAVEVPEAVELDPTVRVKLAAEQPDYAPATVEQALAILAKQRLAFTPVTRSAGDTNAITFTWPVADAEITGEKSINNAEYVGVEGVIAFLRTDAERHYYTLAFDAADRPTSEGHVRYRFTTEDHTGHVVLLVTPSGVPPALAADIDSIKATLEKIPQEGKTFRYRRQAFNPEGEYTDTAIENPEV